MKFPHLKLNCFSSRRLFFRRLRVRGRREKEIYRSPPRTVYFGARFFFSPSALFILWMGKINEMQICGSLNIHLVRIFRFIHCCCCCQFITSLKKLIFELAINHCERAFTEWSVTQMNLSPFSQVLRNHSYYVCLNLNRHRVLSLHSLGLRLRLTRRQFRLRGCQIGYNDNFSFTLATFFSLTLREALTK